MKLIIIDGEGNQLAPPVGAHFKCDVMPKKGHQLALPGEEDEQAIARVGFTIQNDELVPTIWLATSPGAWIGSLTG